MSNPRFMIGEAVAVCTCDFSIVIPSAIVLSRAFKQGGIVTVGLHAGQMGFNGWYYELDALRDRAVHESALRPYRSGDYAEDTQDLHKPVEVNV